MTIPGSTDKFEPTFTPNVAGCFATFQEWVHFAHRRIADEYCPTSTIGQPYPAVCIDARGCGGDFMRARDEDAFPVYYFWDCKP